MFQPVIDRTGLNGRYSFPLNFTPDENTPGVHGPCGESADCTSRLAARGISAERPSTFKSSDTIFKALEKLGLKLEKTKAPAGDALVIDHAERPRPNEPVEDALPPARAKGAAGDFRRSYESSLAVPTLFVLAAAIAASALRKNGAHVRHRVWLAASLKFLVPFSLLIALGAAVSWRTAAQPAASIAPAFAVD